MRTPEVDSSCELGVKGSCVTCEFSHFCNGKWSHGTDLGASTCAELVTQMTKKIKKTIEDLFHYDCWVDPNRAKVVIQCLCLVQFLLEMKQQQLSRFLLSLSAVCDEIVFVDGSSTDKTLAIAEKYTDQRLLQARKNYC